MQVGGLVSTDLFVGSERRPRQLVRVAVRNEGPSLLRPGQTAAVRIDGAGIATPEPAVVRDVEPGAELTVAVAVEVDPSFPPGTARRVTVVADTGAGRSRVPCDMEVAATGWTMFMVSHFHYDPVWWNTQAGFTATWYDLPGAEERRAPEVRTAFDLVRCHVEAAEQDPDYKFVLAELDYLKPYWDTYPGHRARLRRLLADGRIEIVGGNYNEPNTNLTAAETTIRSAVYGIGYQREVLGGDPRTAWMLDVFGHDPAYPGLMADAGLSSGSWARGPFHQWGPRHTVGDNRRMQFPSEFDWISPDGGRLLTSYMPNHYGAGWPMSTLASLEEAEAEAYRQFQDLKTAAATRNTLLPVGGDHVVPSRWATAIHRDWNERYVWPRFVVALPREFFAAVREESEAAGTSFAPQSRDMNPVYTGKDVSYIDTKQAQRAAETAVLDAERLATLAGLVGASDGDPRRPRYPVEALDKAWRQLLFGAHHDAITGTESDQVYLDLLGGWREGHDLGDRIRREAIDHLGARVDTRGEGLPILVFNTLSWPRSDVATVTLPLPDEGVRAVEIRDDAGAEVAATIAGRRLRADGSLAEVALSFVAREVPALGYRTYRAVPLPHGQSTCDGWAPRADSDTADGDATDSERPVERAGERADRYAIDNACFRIEADPARGGGLVRILDKRSDREVLRPGEVANELVLFDEYPNHPDFAEGPWHLLPTGATRGSAHLPAAVRVETAPAAQRLVSTWSLDDLRVTQEVTLWGDADRIDFRTHVDGSIGHDRLLRTRFPVAVTGGRPVYEVGNAAIGRTFGLADVDAARAPWTYDNPAYTWVALGSTARVALLDADGGAQFARTRHAIGVAEVVAPRPGDPAVRDLVAALVAQGVTATCTTPAGPRYGASDLDSNLPDVRIALGGPEDNPFTAAVLDTADPRYGEHLRDRVSAEGTARAWVPARRAREDTWVPNADLRGVLDLPVLVVAGRDLADEAGALAADLRDSTIDVVQRPDLDGPAQPLDDYSVALVNGGTPSACVDAGGTISLSLLRSCSGWPAGVWIDAPRRTAPDGSSFAWQHWSHTFVYSLVAGRGDWRDAGFVHHGRELNHELLATQADVHHGKLPATASLLRVEPRGVVLAALKPRGNPIASGRPGEATRNDLVTVRCYEAHGRPADARVRCAAPLRDAQRADVLEDRGDGDHDDGDHGVAAADGDIRVHVAAAENVTVTAAAGSPAAGEPLPAFGPRGEPAQPVYTRYWLHNKGPAPYGYEPVSVHVDPTELAGDDTVTVTVASSATEGVRTGRVYLGVPPGLTVAPGGDLSYVLRPGEHAAFEIDVRTADATPGRYFLAARIHDDLGQSLEDVVTVDAGTAPGPEEELAATPLTSSLRLPAGGAGTLAVRLDNACRSEIRGEAQLLSPYGTWEALGPWSQGCDVGPGGSATVRFDVRIPVTAWPGEYWAVIKVMYYGRVRFTEAIPVIVV